MSENVISFEIKRKEYLYNKCLHNKVSIDTETGLIECKDCKAVITPYKYVLGIAEEQRAGEYKINTLRKELQALKKKTKVKCRHCNKFTPIDNIF